MLGLFAFAYHMMGSQQRTIPWSLLRWLPTKPVGHYGNKMRGTTYEMAIVLATIATAALLLLGLGPIAGTLTYHCTLHPEMAGSIIVASPTTGDAATTEEAPAA